MREVALDGHPEPGVDLQGAGVGVRGQPHVGIASPPGAPFGGIEQSPGETAAPEFRSNRKFVHPDLPGIDEERRCHRLVIDTNHQQILGVETGTCHGGRLPLCPGQRTSVRVLGEGLLEQIKHRIHLVWCGGLGAVISGAGRCRQDP